MVRKGSRAAHQSFPQRAVHRAMNRQEFIVATSHRLWPSDPSGKENTRRAGGWTPEALWPSAIPGEWMEHCGAKRAQPVAADRKW
jgi:hypothetical protein